MAIRKVRDLAKAAGAWGTKWSLWPPHLVTACCGVELAHAFGPAYDAERLGVLPMPSARHSNLLIIEGTITLKMAKFVKWVYEQMPEPKYVVAMGACAIKGGVFYGSYHMVPASNVVGVDVYVSGCPPTPEALLKAVEKVQENVGRPAGGGAADGAKPAEWPFDKRPGSTFFVEREEELAPGERGLVLVVGPQHPGSGHMRLFVVVDGDVIADVKPDPGFVHRGVEKLAERRPFWTVPPLVEKVSIMDSTNAILPYVHAVERALGLEPPPRAKALRSLMAELGRIRTHLYDLALHGIFIGHSTAFMWGFGMGDMIAEVQARVTGARTTSAYPIPGGVRRDLTTDGRQAVERLLAKLKARLPDFEKLFLKNPVVRMRLEGVGVLDARKAASLGAVGPAARGSGIDYDARTASPYDGYELVRPRVVVEKGGDAMARTSVRWGEIWASIEYIEEALRALPDGDILDEALLELSPNFRREGVAGIFGVLTQLRPEPGEYHGLAEMARGTAYVYISATGSQYLRRVRFVTPSWRNLRPMAEAMKGHRLADLPAIYMSFGYFPPEADR
ncbi:NADH-quinone oxidoreductase subunits B and D [Thermoproteus uzoniensis 768-20]|uniref:NADH-quinone oxidoreductase subunits B and D n=1 Tax=Thermoproteus uzoniensis (strain 768-20) TaxID=999630 RepID=F2L625_THEU7|nr:NADH-quinone oxidoreductase subunit NuoB [Thermoproteus uzoniensis]AEA12470.1 NADH-quinone oxidoreductase subunits B and D [Thermoproteus uzoniensis 768-20]